MHTGDMIGYPLQGVLPDYLPNAERFAIEDQVVTQEKWLQQLYAAVLILLGIALVGAAIYFLWPMVVTFCTSRWAVLSVELTPHHWWDWLKIPLIVVVGAFFAYLAFLFVALGLIFLYLTCVLVAAIAIAPIYFAVESVRFLFGITSLVSIPALAAGIFHASYWNNADVIDSMSQCLAASSAKSG